MLNWIRNIDMRKVTAVFMAMTTVETLIVSGEISLKDIVPADWIPHIIAYCKFFIVVNQVLNGLHMATAAKWEPQPLTGAINNKSLVVPFILAFGATLALAMPHPAAAQTRHHRYHIIQNPPIPLERPGMDAMAALKKPPLPFVFQCWPNTNFPLGCTPAGSTSATTAATTVATPNPLTMLQSFSWADLDNARQDALGQTPPNTTAAQCWTYLESLVPAPATATTTTTTSTGTTTTTTTTGTGTTGTTTGTTGTTGTTSTGTTTASTPPASTVNTATSLLPTTPGVASAIQKALDDEQLLLNWLSPNGGLAQLNLACAPLVNMLNAKLVAGGGITAAGIAAAANPATAPLIAGIGTLLTGTIALFPK